MKYLLIILCSAIIQLSSAQIMSLGIPNGATSLQNLPRTVTLQNNGLNLPNGFGVPNFGPNIQIAKNLPCNGNGNLIPSNLGANFISNGNIIGNNLANIGTNVLAGQSNYVNAVVPVNMANGFNINTGTFAVANTGLAKILNLPCGVQILGDALEVGGTVGVNGKLPFYATVAAKGQLPTTGYGYANCACGQ